MFWWTVLLSVAFCWIHRTSSQIIYRGKCPTPEIQEDFNATMFSGRWYEDSRSFALFQLSLKCVETDFDADPDGRLAMRISGIDIIGGNRSYTGKLEIRNTSEPARMKTRFRFLPMSMNYIILHTDYNNTAVIWSCHNLFSGRLGHLENLWVLSRRPKLPPYMKHELYDLLDARGVKRQFLQATDQNDCPRGLSSADAKNQNSTQALGVTAVVNSTSQDVSSSTPEVPVQNLEAKKVPSTSSATITISTTGAPQTPDFNESLSNNVVFL